MMHRYTDPVITDESGNRYGCCPICRQWILLGADGKLADHRAWDKDPGLCSGSAFEYPERKVDHADR